jgi:hypothetical protein
MFKLLNNNIELNQISGGCTERNTGRYRNELSTCSYDLLGKLCPPSDCGCPETEPETYHKFFCRLKKTSSGNQYICGLIPSSDLHMVLHEKYNPRHV